MNHDIRPRVGIEFLRRRQLSEIVVFTARDKDFTAAAFAQLLDDIGAEEACAAGDAHAAAVPEARWMIVVSGLVHGRVFLRLSRLLRPYAPFAGQVAGGRVKAGPQGNSGFDEIGEPATSDFHLETKRGG